MNDRPNEGAATARTREDVNDDLLRLASKARYFRAPDGRLHARVPEENRHEDYALQSRAFRDWLAESYRCERNERPSERALGGAISSLEARARLDRSVPRLHVRVARASDGDRSGAEYYIDLGDESGRAIKINAQEWLVVEQPPVTFRRAQGLLPLPMPVRGGSVGRLRAYVNLGEADFRLLVAWIASALQPEGPYPVLALHGEQGSAKSTLARVIRLLVDPQSPPVLTQPKSTRDLMVTACGGWLLAYDNISTLASWLSDSFCQLSTGGGFAGRALFTDDERTLVFAQRPVILNGIDEFVRRDDLADRCVFLHLPTISPTHRRAEVEFWQSFRADYPVILGGLLDAIVWGIHELESPSELEALPRMADFARLGEAMGRGLGWPHGTFLEDYAANRQAATVLAIEESPVAQALIRSAKYGGLRDWTLTATEMLTDLTRDARERGNVAGRWPKTARELGNELRRIAPLLRTRGIIITFIKTPERRLITIDAEDNSDAEESSD